MKTNYAILLLHRTGKLIWTQRIKTKLVKDFILWSVVSLGLFASQAEGQIIYSNSGNNITGWTVTYPYGATLVSNGTDIVLEEGGIWDTTPVTVTGNFQISYDVYNNSGDGDSHLMLLNNGTTGGVGVTNSPENTDSPSINIVSATDFTNYSQYFFPTSAETLATASSLDFPNDTCVLTTI